MIGNKGGIGISFKLGKTNLLFISCHLAAGQEGVERRNQDFNKIFRHLVLNKSTEPEKVGCIGQKKSEKIKKNMVASELVEEESINYMLGEGHLDGVS